MTFPIHVSFDPSCNKGPSKILSIPSLFRRSYSNQTFKFLDELLMQAEWTLDHESTICKPPCLQTRIRSTFLINSKSINQNRSVELIFRPSVEVIFLHEILKMWQIKSTEVVESPLLHFFQCHP